jgi:PAS domain S-box-containing protein
MKILYVGTERAARLAAKALHTLAPDVGLAWAGSLATAVHWVDDNRIAAAFVIEAEVQNQSCASLVDHIRGLGLPAPIVVVAPERMGVPLAALKAGADDYIAANQSFADNLPDIVRRAMQRVQATTYRAGKPLRLLYVGDARLARLCFETPPGSVEITEAGREPNGTFQPIPPEFPASGLPLPFDVLFVEHDHPGVDAIAILRDIADRGLHVPVILVVEWDEKIAVPALKLGAVDHVVKSVDSFRALRVKLDRGLAGSAEARIRESEDRLQATIQQERAEREALAEKLAEVEKALLETEQLRASEAAAFADQLAQRDAEFRASLAQGLRARETLKQELSDAAAALEMERRDRASDAAAAAEHLSRREGELGATLEEVTATRNALEQKLADAEAARQDAQQRQASELTTVRTHFAEREAEYRTQLAQDTADRGALEQQLTDAVAALEAVRQDRATEAATVAEQLRRREAEFGATLEEATATRNAVERKLADAEAALQDARQQQASELTTVRTHFAEREAEYRTQLAQTTADRGALEQQLTDAVASLQQAEQLRASEAAASADHLARRSAEFAATVAEVARSRDTLAQQLSDAEAALEQGRQARAADTAAAAEHLARREAEFGDALAEATNTRNALEQKLAAAQAAFQHAEQQASQRLSELQERLTEQAAARKALEQRLAEAETAFQEAEQRHSSELATAAAHFADREAQYDASLAQAAAARDELQLQLVEREAAHAELTASLAELTRSHDTLAHQLSDAEAALEKDRQARAADAAAAAERLARREMELEAELNQQVGTRAALQHDLEETRLASEQAQQRYLDEATTMRQEASEREARLEERAARERADHERVLAERQEEIRHIQQTLDQVRADFQAVARVSSEHATERARLGTVVAERDAQLREQAARHLASQEAAQDTLAQIEDKLRQTLQASSRDLAQLQAEVKSLSRELDATRSQRDALQTDADRLPQVQSQLDGSRAELRRQFEYAPYGKGHWRPDGAVLSVNRALVRLLGYRTADQLLQVDFATRVFESAEDLRWLIERCLSTGEREALETRWRRKDGEQLVVRLLAVAGTPETIEIIAEDLTNLRNVERQLRQAQRMEAVGRLASEVAMTCDNLLRDVSLDGQQWLAAIGSDTALRHQGELLLREVTRAAGLLRQLAVYGNKQTSALEPVNVNRVLRDLGAVLKRVAGHDIELGLPKASRPINVDVEPELLERIFVNVASYARTRMPHGGRLKIELATVVLDSKFITKYPNVRPGSHALITVTELGDTDPADVPVEPQNEPTDANAGKRVSDRPGVDLGVLLSLIGDCGGHLWMSAEPRGNMVLKIHLPEPASAPTDRPPPVPQTAQSRPKARWFRH